MEGHDNGIESSAEVAQLLGLVLVGGGAVVLVVDHERRFDLEQAERGLLDVHVGEAVISQADRLLGHVHHHVGQLRLLLRQVGPALVQLADDGSAPCHDRLCALLLVHRTGSLGA